jgi:SAM-dependent methyltransferase
MSGISAAAALTPGKVQSWRRRVFDKCYENMSTDVAKTASMAERSEKNLNELTLLYGEMEYSALVDIFSRVNKFYTEARLQKKDLNFVDLGCGTGKTVVGAALCGEAFASCHGVEILEQLLAMAGKATAIFEESKRAMPEFGNHDNSKTTLVFEAGDITEYDLADADVAMANSTGFDQPLMKKIAKQASKMKAGSIFITSSYRLPTASFEVVETFESLQSWGTATIFIHKKLSKKEALMARLARSASGNKF